jgi:type VI secretion system protein ImpC
MANDATQKEAQVGGGLAELDEFSDILKQTIKPRTEEAAKEVDNAIVALVKEAMSDDTVIADDVIDTIQAMLAKIDAKLTEQVNQIIHAPEFQQLESSWRGLAYTINNSETDASLRVKVMNVSKNELKSELRRFPGAKWDKSPLFLKVYEQEFGTMGGKPFGCLIGDYYFDQSTGDVNLLRDMGKIAAAAHAPFISAANPTLLGLDSWTEIGNPPDLSEIFETPDYAAWNTMRDSENSRYVGLVMPRVLSREPYSQNGTAVVEEFNFEEQTDGHAGGMYAWMNAAHAMAANINRAFKEHGWTVRIRGVQSGGEVMNLPTHTFDSGDGLIHRKHTDKAAFIGAQSLYRPKKYVDDLATASDNMSSRLPYIFAVSRFSHYLKCMVRDKIGTSPDRVQLEKDLQTWINKYVAANPESATEKEKAKKPLAGATVQVIADEENPGYYMGKFFLKPHFQMEGMDIGMSLVSKLPGGK